MLALLLNDWPRTIAETMMATTKFIKCRTLVRRIEHISVKAPGGYFQIRRPGGLGPHIKFGGKIWGKVRRSSTNKRKNLGSSVTTRRKSWEKVPILGSYLKFTGQNLGYLSLIFLEAKFGTPSRILEANFGAKPPPPPPPTS